MNDQTNCKVTYVSIFHPYAMRLSAATHFLRSSPRPFHSVDWMHRASTVADMSLHPHLLTSSNLSIPPFRLYWFSLSDPGSWQMSSPQWKITHIGFHSTNWRLVPACIDVLCGRSVTNLPGTATRGMMDARTRLISSLKPAILNYTLCTTPPFRTGLLSSSPLLRGSYLKAPDTITKSSQCDAVSCGVFTSSHDAWYDILR